MDVPWWALSPSPWTLAYLSILAFYAENKILKDVQKYGLRKFVSTFCAAAFIVGLVEMPVDIVWCVGQQLRFGYLYPQDYTLYFSIGRDIAIIILCLLETKDIIWRFNWNTWTSFFTALLIVFIAIWFTFSPDQSWTDWTYAIRFESGHILESFIISHVIGKVIVGGLFISLFKK